MPGDDLVRMVPILTARELPPVVAFYEELGLQVTADHGDYVLLAADAVEVHLSQWDDHDPLTTANMLRVGSPNP